eukprot:7685544-Karenia_brevis.AAC.1
MYIRHVQKYGAHNKPFFSLINDGDLWHYIYKVILARGADSIRVSKTKGHAYEDREYMESIRNDPKQLYDAMQNEKADRIAGAARDHFYNKNVIDLSNLLAERQEAYTKFVHAVHSILLRTYFASQALKEHVAFKAITPELSAPAPIHYQPALNSTPSHTFQLEFKVDQTLMNKYLDTTSPTIRGMHKIMVHTTQHRLPTTDNPGITWLELLLLSLAASGQHLSILGVNIANKRKSIKLTLQQFIGQARNYIGFAFTTSTAVVFSTCDVGTCRLKQFGHQHRAIHT